jgi:gliding motility associated protien GldN
MRITILISIIWFSLINSKAQSIFDPATPDPCSSFSKTHTVQKKPIAYPYLREGDVAWEKRIWREIDLREKQNLKYYYPVDLNPCVHSLFQVLCKQILNGSILAFKDEEFVVPYERSEVRRLLVKQDTVPQFIVDEFGNEKEVMVSVADSTSIYRNILKYRLKEDWYFDKQRSVLEVRIIGLAAYEYIDDKEAYRELFWVYFPACRETLAQASAFNTRNDNEFRSFDELFMKRDFNSLIIKESNVYDRYIYQYMKGIDALTEADDIKMDLFDWEHDLWNY